MGVFILVFINFFLVKINLDSLKNGFYANYALQKEGGSMRALVVLVIEEGKLCKSCILIVTAGNAASVIP